MSQYIPLVEQPLVLLQISGKASKSGKASRASYFNHRETGCGCRNWFDTSIFIKRESK
jgi:hypothetical protein